VILELLLGRSLVLHSVQSDICRHPITVRIFVFYINLFISARCFGAGWALTDEDALELTFVTI